MAERMGGYDWWRRYAEGDSEVIEVIARHFALGSAYYRLPENQPSLSGGTLTEIITAFLIKLGYLKQA